MLTMKTPTELVHRVFLTVLLVGILGNCAESPQELGEESQVGIRIDMQTPEHGEDQDGIAKTDQTSVLADPPKENNSSDNYNNHDKDKDDDVNSSLSRSIPFYYGNTNTRNYEPNSNSNSYDSYYGSPSSPSSSYYQTSQRDRDRDRDRNYDRYGDSNNRNNRPSSITPGMQTVISSTSYSIKPGSGGSGSNVYMNTKPVPIIVSSTGPTVGGGVGVGIGMSGSRREEGYYVGNSRDTNYHNRPGPGSPSPSYDFPRRDSSDYNRNNYGPAATPSNSNFNMDCINGNGNRRNCPKGDSYYNEDENRSYYAVLNGNLKQGYGTGIRRHDDDTMESELFSSERYHATFPFTVHGLVPEKERFYTDAEDDFPKRRVTRTSTTSSPPGWVKLQPISSRKTYDPFFTKEKEVNKKHSQSQNGQQSKISKGSSDSDGEDKEHDTLKSGSNINSKFSNRLGIELSPESFAERWGWGSGGSGKGSGSRLPSWLEELNHQQQSKGHSRRPAYGTAHTGPTRDEDPQNWVKLDPIPVAGVSISKWVPKGTSPQELPSTGNLIRDRPSAWWDSRPDSSIQKRPTFLHQTIKDKDYVHGGNSNMGWGSSSSSTTSTTRYPILHPQRKPGNGGSWNDIIYPDTPTSATASWQSGGLNSLKGISTYPSSFPSSVSLGWKSDNSDEGGSGSGGSSSSRRPVATWSAPGSSNSNKRFGLRRPSHSYLHSNNGNPSSYPDPHANEDDPRWVLVSNSRRVTGPHHHLISDRHSYRPPLDRYKDDLDWDLDVSESENDRNIDTLYGSSSHTYRRAKDYKLPTESSPPSSNKHSGKGANGFSSTESISPPLPEIYTQEEAFNRVNATLQSLIPVLNLNNHVSNSTRTLRSTPKPKTEATTTKRATIKTTTTSSPLYNKIPASIRNSFLSSLMGTGRQAPAPTDLSTSKADTSSNVNGTKIVISRKPNSLKPILAAVGVGMIPATMAAVLPMVMGRRKKREITNHMQNHNPNQGQSQAPVQLVTPVVFQNQLYLVPSLSPSDQDISRNSRVIRNNYGYEVIPATDPSSGGYDADPTTNAWTNPKHNPHVQYRYRAALSTKSVLTR